MIPVGYRIAGTRLKTNAISPLVSSQRKLQLPLALSVQQADMLLDDKGVSPYFTNASGTIAADPTDHS